MLSKRRNLVYSTASAGRAFGFMQSFLFLSTARRSHFYVNFAGFDYELRPGALENVCKAPALGEKVSAAVYEGFEFSDCVITELMAARPVLWRIQ